MTANGLSPAILSFIDHGAYPESEAISSTHLESSNLASILEALQKEQNSAKEEIRSLSKAAAPDIDTWISRAKALQADILRSRDVAREIVAEHEQGRALKAEVEDYGQKVDLLEKEAHFNEGLTATLEQVREVNVLLERTQDAAVKGDVGPALQALADAEASLAALDSVQGSRAYDVLQERASELKANIVETTTEFWNAIIQINHDEKTVRVHRHGFKAAVPGAAVPEIGQAAIVVAAKGLGVFDSLVQKLSRDVDKTILRPRMVRDEDGLVAKISLFRHGAGLSAAGKQDDNSNQSLFADLSTILDFLADKLPRSIAVALSSSLIPALATRLEEQYLDACIPLHISEVSSFRHTLHSVEELADQVDEFGWHGSKTLHEWVQDAPRIWLTKRREAMLGDVRDLVFAGLSERKIVERVETRLMTKEDSAMVGGGGGREDDWDTAWDEPEQEATSSKADEDEDASAWDAGDDDPLKEDENTGGEGADDAWGWGDAEEDASSAQPPSPTATKKSQPSLSAKTNGDQPSTKHEMTLRETFTVTSIPDGILSIIQTIISDAQTLARPDFASSPISPAATALYTLPTLALAIYRATAPTAYSKVNGLGNMLIYNDASRLADFLRSWQADQSPGSRLRLDNDVASLEQFAKRAYGSEMDSQRTILGDLLDGAQGFSNCTTQPFKRECEGAVESVVERLRDVYGMWKGVLSEGALLQSLGSLLGTVAGKMITDIQDLGDISEADSQQLKALCDKVSVAKQLFTQQREDGGEAQDMTFIYCPTWLKFQYLAEVLEASLADIRWMWKEGELSLEFEAEEVVELLEALFAESELRRQAVREVRRGR